MILDKHRRAVLLPRCCIQKEAWFQQLVADRQMEFLAASGSVDLARAADLELAVGLVQAAAPEQVVAWRQVAASDQRFAAARLEIFPASGPSMQWVRPGIAL